MADLTQVTQEEVDAILNKRVHPNPNPTLGEWDYDGACRPYESGIGTDNCYIHTFSLGIFQWIAKVRGGLKRGKVFRRFSGPVRDPGSVYRPAQAYIDKLNALERFARTAEDRQGAMAPTDATISAAGGKNDVIGRLG